MKRALLTIILLSCFLPAVLSIPPNVVYKPLESLQHDDKDSRCIAAALHNEARGEPIKGIRAVYDSILARMKKRNKTACQIVLEKHQYTGMTRNKIKNVSEEALTDLETIGRMHPVVEGCTHYYANYILPPKWVRDMKSCGKVGKHLYFKEKEK